MSLGFNIDWSEAAEIENEFFNPDQLGREKYARFLANFLLSRDTKKSFVLNLDSSWGTGKSYFLKRFKNSVMEHHPVVYIDAWKEDYSNDPFVSVVSSIISQLRSHIGKGDDAILSKIYNGSAVLIKSAGPILAGAIAKKYLGKGVEDIFRELEHNTQKVNCKSDSSKVIGDVASKLAQVMIANHEKKSASIKSLKVDVEEWIGAIYGHKKTFKKPTVIIIDELDRCRPSYAVEMLETVKHIFDIPGVFFIVATDTEQLQHAIKVIYGTDFDAQNYLTRFFDIRFKLNEFPLQNLIKEHCNYPTFSMSDSNDNLEKIFPNSSSVLDGIADIIDAFSLSPRLAIQIVTRVDAIIAHADNKTSFDIYYLVMLLCLKSKNKSAYDILVGDALIDNVSAFFDSVGLVFNDTKVNVVCEYKRGTYVFMVPLETYFKEAVERRNKSIKTNNGLADEVLGKNISNFEAILDEYIAKNRNSRLNDSFRKDIFLYEYYLRGLNKKGVKHYRDLVELSASLS